MNIKIFSVFIITFFPLTAMNVVKTEQNEKINQLFQVVNLLIQTNEEQNVEIQDLRQLLNQLQQQRTPLNSQQGYRDITNTCL